MDSGVGLIQPDVMWMGGPSEFRRVVAIASARGIAVVPHGCGVYGYHMALAFPEIPLAEFLVMSENGDEAVSHKALVVRAVAVHRTIAEHILLHAFNKPTNFIFGCQTEIIWHSEHH
jgi:L-alanine-DL-glutamate epimerase-like enolase superfamily enzyme